MISRAVGVDPRDARPRRGVSRTRRPDDLHEGAGVRRRDRRGQGVARRDLPARPPITPMRSPARPTSDGWWSTNGWKGSPRRGRGRDRPTTPRFGGADPRDHQRRPIPRSSACRDLLTGPGIRKHGEAILAGSRIRDEVLARFPERVLGWLTDADGPPPPDRIDRLAPPERSVVQASSTYRGRTPRCCW